MNPDSSDNNEVLELALPPDTERLRFRLVRPDDHESVRAIYADDLAQRFLPDMRSPDGVHSFILRQLRRYEKFGYGIWLLETLENPRIVGDAGITWQETDLGDVMEIGYGLAADERGNGYATEAAKACLAFSFEVLGANRIASLVSADNTPSQKVAERVHAQRRDFTHPRLGPDFLMYYTDNQV
ncbi:MAG: GNAT family N-acetyltransferase [Gammaproteobacteria bacterium]|nr:GNAT family N-acetyltransferase [Gammaproteobacteria bacterium]